MTAQTPQRPSPRNVILVGPMGAGKTAVGHALAARLGWEFLDTDAALERRAGMGIPQFFSSHGETEFRSLETDVAREAVAGERHVVATGGGILKTPGNREMLERGGAVVLLQSSAEAICQRIGHSRHRPLIDPADPLGSIRRLLAERRDLYEQIPTRIDTSDLTPEQSAARIVEMLEIEPDYA